MKTFLEEVQKIKAQIEALKADPDSKIVARELSELEEIVDAVIKLNNQPKFKDEKF